MRPRPFLLAGLMLAMSIGGAHAADIIEGAWQTPDGGQVNIATCSQGYCVAVANGEYAGVTIGYLAPTQPGHYEGKIARPSDPGKAFDSKADVSGSTLTLTGCAAVVLCSTQTWLQHQ